MTGAIWSGVFGGRTGAGTRQFKGSERKHGHFEHVF